MYEYNILSKMTHFSIVRSTTYSLIVKFQHVFTYELDILINQKKKAKLKRLIEKNIMKSLKKISVVGSLSKHVAIF